jgi:glycosyltransferase involved in cell wall biosynthesis
MRIAVLAPVSTPVPPDAYGGTEAVVGTLADGLVDAGHDVTLFATRDSTTKATLVAPLDEPPRRPGRQTDAEVHHALTCVKHAAEFDAVSSHLGPLGAALANGAVPPVVHTVSDPIDRTRGTWRLAAGMAPDLRLVSVSRRQQELAPDLPWLANCYNGLDLDRYPFRAEGGDYLAFVGRMSPDKGCHLAIQVARAAGLPLRIAAKMREPHEEEYFKTRVLPHLDGEIEYLGEVDHEEKVGLLGGARATLYPVDVEEAFGLVMAESMACGTPVVALRRGSVPEVVEHGRTGFVVESAGELAAAAVDVGRIERRECRQTVEGRFSAEQLVRAYERAFARAVSNDYARG